MVLVYFLIYQVYHFDAEANPGEVWIEASVVDTALRLFTLRFVVFFEASTNNNILSQNYKNLEVLYSLYLLTWKTVCFKLGIPFFFIEKCQHYDYIPCLITGNMPL